MIEAIIEEGELGDPVPSSLAWIAGANRKNVLALPFNNVLLAGYAYVEITFSELRAQGENCDLQVQCGVNGVFYDDDKQHWTRVMTGSITDDARNCHLTEGASFINITSTHVGLTQNAASAGAIVLKIFPAEPSGYSTMIWKGLFTDAGDNTKTVDGSGVCLIPRTNSLLFKMTQYGEELTAFDVKYTVIGMPRAVYNGQEIT